MHNFNALIFEKFKSEEEDEIIYDYDLRVLKILKIAFIKIKPFPLMTSFNLIRIEKCSTLKFEEIRKRSKKQEEPLRLNLAW